MDVVENIVKKENLWLQPRTIVALAVSLLALAEIVDMTIVAVAVPDMMGALGANISEMSMTMTSYIVAAAICIPLTGLLTAKYGLKRVILASAILFCVSSILCGIATSVTEMVVFRVIQGVGGAFLPAVAQSYINDTFENEDKAKIMTMYSLIVVMGPILGPVLGGYIVENFNWRWIFYINVPICIVAFILIYTNLKHSITKNIKIDYISFVFMMIGIGCLEYFLDEGNSNNWLDSGKMIIILAFAIFGIGFFIWRGILGKSVINLELFKHKNFVLCCLAMFVFVIIMGGVMTFFPTMLQQSYGYPVDLSGYVTAPRGMAALVCAPLFMKLAQKIDMRYILFFGIAMMTGSGFYSCLFSLTPSIHMIIVLDILQAVGMMAAFMPLMQLVYTGLDKHMTADASGVFNFFRNFGSSVGTSIASTILAHNQQVSWHDLTSHINNFSHSFQLNMVAMKAIPQALRNPIIASNISAQSTFISFLDVFYFFSVLGVLIIWVPFVLTKPDPNQVVEVAAH